MILHVRHLLTLVFAVFLIAACGGEQPPAADFELDVSLAGTGSGSVTSNPAGIDTDAASFEAVFTDGTVVTLTAAPDAGSDFVAWSGACTGSDVTCDVTMDAAKSVTATFDLEPGDTNAVVTVVVDEEGAATGFVTSDPEGIDADNVSAEFPVGSTVDLTATATNGFFTGWIGGDCDGLFTPTCTVTVNEGEPTVTATFRELDAQLLSVSVSSNADDAEEFLTASTDDPVRWPAGFNRNSSSDIELAFDPDHAAQVIGLRFANVDVPDGAQIVSAFLDFTAFASPTTGTAGEVALTIGAQASADPDSFVTDPGNPAIVSSDLSSRGLTTASADWTITEAWTADEVYTSSDVSAVLQEVVDLAGWEAGKAVAFIIRGDPDSAQYRRAYAHDAGPANAPTLRIQYVLPNGS